MAKTSDLKGAALDWAVAKAEGRALREPLCGTDQEAEKLTVPFTMYEVTAKQVGDNVTYHVETVTVTRYGCLPGCSGESISFVDGAGHKALGSVSLFYFDKAEAELECLGNAKGYLEGFHPSTCWSQGGPIIDRIKGFLLKQWLDCRPESCCQAEIHNLDGNWIMFGPTPLIAAMRCYVASKFGDTIDLPEGLVND